MVNVIKSFSLCFNVKITEQTLFKIWPIVDEKWFYLFVSYLSNLVLWKDSNELLCVIPLMYLEGMSCLTHMRIHPPIYCMVKTERFWKSFNDKLGFWERFINFGFLDHKKIKLALTRSTRDSNLFLTEFILIWSIMILNGFSFLSCFISSKLLQEAGFQTGVSNGRGFYESSILYY